MLPVAGAQIGESLVCVIVCVRVCVYVCICSYICTANPTCGDIFESSKVEGLFGHVSVTRDIRPLSFEL